MHKLFANRSFSSADKEADYLVKVSSVQISPDPIARGKPAKFKITANAGKLDTLHLVELLIFGAYTNVLLDFTSGVSIIRQ